MPSRKTKIKGRKYLDLCHPIENETREQILEAVSNKYDEDTEE